MQTTFAHPGRPFAALTAAAREMLDGVPSNSDLAARILWDWDERTSVGSQRRASMQVAGVGIDPDDFNFSQNIKHYDPDFDREGNAYGGGPYVDHENYGPARELLEAIFELPDGDRVLLALWSPSGAGYVTLVEGGTAYVDPDEPHTFDGFAWTQAAKDARPRWIAEHPSRQGIAVVLLDTQVPVDTAHGHSSGLEGLRGALEELLYTCPSDQVFVQGSEPDVVTGVCARLRAAAEAHDRLVQVGGVSNSPTVDWYLFGGGVQEGLLGQVFQFRADGLITETARAEESFDLLRAFGIEGGFDRVVIAQIGSPYASQDFRRQLPEALAAHNQATVGAIRSVDAYALDPRLSDLHEVWDALASWEGPVGSNISSDEFIRAYAERAAIPREHERKSSPRIVWIGSEAGTRPGDYLEGLAGRYHADENLLELNSDFPAFRALAAYWKAAYGNADGEPLPLFVRADEEPPEEHPHDQRARAITDTVEAVVLEYCEQTLVEVVVGVNQLAGRPGWEMDRVEKALSPEALSGAAMAIYHVQASIKRSLGQRLGSLKKETVV